MGHREYDQTARKPAPDIEVVENHRGGTWRLVVFTKHTCGLTVGLSLDIL